MASLSAIRTGIKTRLTTAYPNVVVYDYIPPKLELDENGCIVIGLQDPFVDYDLTMGGGATYWFTLRCFAGKAPGNEQAQDTLDAFGSATGSTSVYAAIEADPTLGGTADSTMVQRARGFGAVSVGETQYLVIDIDIECLTS